MAHKCSFGTRIAWDVGRCLLLAAACFSPALALHARAQAGEGVAVPQSTKLTLAEMEKLLAPIALYPDTLLANVLAASVYPSEVAEAAAFVTGGGKPAQIDSKTWEPPVKAIAKVPDAVKMMGEYADWTAALGQAYLLQAQDVMRAVQSLREKAKANGKLVSTSEQTVATDGDTIIIVPSEPDVIYVPSYDPVYIYDPYPPSNAWAGFAIGVWVGAVWSDVDCDWDNDCIGCGWGNTDIDINVDGDINIGNSVGRPTPYTGQEGNAWKPNKSKVSQTSRTDKLQQYRGSSGGARPATPKPVAANPSPTRKPAQPSRASAPPARPATPPKQPAQPAQPARAATPPSRPSAGATPKIPPSAPSLQKPGAFSGGRSTRAASTRGAASRGGAQPSRGGGRRR